MRRSVTANHHDLILAGPVGSLDAYINGVNQCPVLSQQEEHDLARRFREHDDLDAAQPQQAGLAELHGAPLYHAGSPRELPVAQCFDRYLGLERLDEELERLGPRPAGHGRQHEKQ